jgi:Clathrin light chain
LLTIFPLSVGQSSLGLNPESTTTGDFLSREQAALGDDAKLFASPNDNYKSSTVEEDDDDLLGGGSGIARVEGMGKEVTEFESAFPIIDHSNEVGLSHHGHISSKLDCYDLLRGCC